MKVSISRDNIQIVPEGPADELYLENVILGQHGAKAVRMGQQEGKSWGLIFLAKAPPPKTEEPAA